MKIPNQLKAGWDWLARLVRQFKPSPTFDVKWEGKCSLCGGRAWSSVGAPDDPETVECNGCAYGFSEAGKRRVEDRRQIDLYKQAIREIEAEKNNPANGAVSDAPKTR